MHNPLKCEYEDESQALADQKHLQHASEDRSDAGDDFGEEIEMQLDQISATVKKLDTVLQRMITNAAKTPKARSAKLRAQARKIISDVTTMDKTLRARIHVERALRST